MRSGISTSKKRVTFMIVHPDYGRVTIQESATPSPKLRNAIAAAMVEFEAVYHGKKAFDPQTERTPQ